MLDGERLEHALTLSTPEWISFYGGGRHRSFIYESELYAEYVGQHFHGMAAFLRTIGSYEKRSIVWSRLKAGWDLDSALSVPVEHDAGREGLIYKLTRKRTGQVYVGLTVGSLDQRWFFHVSSARNGAQSRLAKAIRADGPRGFSREVLEDGIGDPSRLKNREIYWVRQLEALGPKGLNSATPGALGSPRGKPTKVDGETFRSLREAAEVLAKRTGLQPHVVESRIRSGTPIPTKARRHSNHPDAGSDHFRRWLGLLRRHGENVEPIWADDYDRFKSDVLPSYQPSRELIRKDASRPWGPTNFEWLTVRQKIERVHGRAFRVHDVEYPSLKALAEEFGIGVSTLKDRIGRQGLSPEDAVEIPLGVTSFRQSESGRMVDGKVFRSKRQATLYFAKTRGISEHKAKYQLGKGDPE